MVKLLDLSLGLLFIFLLTSARSVSARTGASFVPSQASPGLYAALSSAVHPSLVLAIAASPTYSGGDSGNQYGAGKGENRYGKSDDSNHYRKSDEGNRYEKGDDGNKFGKGDDDKNGCDDGKKYGDCEEHKGPAPIPEPSTLLSFGAALVIGCGVLYSRRLRRNRK